MRLDQGIIKDYYKLNTIYSDRFKQISQLINESTDVPKNMEQMIKLQKEYENKRNNILGLETIKIINHQYIKEFNDENSYLMRSNTSISSF